MKSLRAYLVATVLLGSLQTSEAQRAPGDVPPPGDDANKPTDGKPTEPVDAKPVDAKPVDAKPVDAKPVDAKKPVDVIPADAKPVDVIPADPGPPSESAPVESALEDDLLESLVEILETPVSVATKFATSLESVPAAVTVYSRDDIEAWGFTSIAEVLRFTVGFYVVDDHSIPNVGTRGFSGGLFGESGNIKVLINGNSVAFRSTGGNWLGPELIPMSAVERIEIVRGPVSSLYGADAFLGVVNIVTRKADAIAGGQVRAGARVARGKAAGNDIEMLIGGVEGPVEVMGALIRSTDDRPALGLPGSSPDPQVPANQIGQTSTAPAGLTSLSALAQVRYHATQKLELSASVYRSQIDRDAQFSPWLQLTSGVDAQGRSQATHIALGNTQLLLNATYEPKPRLKLSLDAFYFRGGPRAGDRIEVGSDVFFVERRLGFEGFETRAEAAWSPTNKIDVVAGAELIRDLEEPLYGRSVLKSDVGELKAQDVIASAEMPNDQLLYNSGVYSLVNWKAINRYLTLSGGVRIDRHSVYGNQLSGRFGVVSTPIKSLTAKLMAGRAFKAPSPLLLYSTPLRVGDISGNSNLAPQVIQTVEGILNWVPFSSVRVSSELAYSVLNDKAEFVQQGLDRLAQNISEVRSLSWATELRARHRFFEGIASFETQKVAQDSGDRGYAAELVGNDNGSYPSYIARLGALFTYREKHVRLGGQMLRVGRRSASESNILARGESYDLPAYTLVNLRVSSVGLHLTQAGKETALSAEVTNLFDQRGPDPGFAGVDYPLTRRTFFISLRQEL